ncbi:MAG: hypothetical protein IJF71_02905, partial [Clostridia bacterium]|nr:hypothetical protein [Clostridia bacterium]
MKDFPVFCYQSTSELYRCPSGGIPKGEAVTFRVKIRRDTFAYHVYFVCQKEGGASYRLSMPWSGLDNGYNVYELNFPVDESGLYFYHFEVDYYGNYVRYGKGEGGFALAQQNPVNFQITCYQPWQTPDWYTGGVMYQIFPDRFCKGEGAVEEKELRAWGDTPEYLPKKGVITNDDFFGGNLWGVIERLPYLKELGVTTLYLNPIFKARSNHRYDTGDYMQVDGLLGGNEAFLALVEKAHKLKMRVVLDGVFNHTGDDSLYFNKYGNYDSIGAYQSKASPYHSWFQFTQFPDKYTSWWGIDTLPSANKSNKGYRRFITGVVRHWLKKGADGWRLDVV